MLPNASCPPFALAHQLVQPEPTGHVPGFPRISIDNKNEVRELLKAEFCSDDLDRMSDKLWWMSKQDSRSISPLHRQTVKRRSIIVTEDPKLHLVWINDRIFIKPLPRFIYSYYFWRDHLCGEEAHIRRSALGYLRTYFYLIQHESDLRIAKDPSLCLVPENITWEQFCKFTSGRDNIADTEVSLRYAHGEIRLTRLNFYAPLILRKSHYQRIEYQYGQYFASFYGPILFSIGVVSVTLSGLQVVASVETNGGANWKQLALGVSVAAILISFGILIGFGIVLVYKIAKEWKFAIQDRRRKGRPKKVEV